MSTKKYTSVSILIVGLLFIVQMSFGQQPELDSASNKPTRIMLAEFHRRIDRATRLLLTRKLSAISDKDHVNIMMCLNTIFLNDRVKTFNDAECKRFLAVANKKDYRNKIGKVYPEWLFNRGMGQYYPKLKMELYGTPNMYATFEVLN
ncbi:hypothetical protein KXD93_15490 [Mucilaginibacter sp. BJC16-A38]|uniref:hypothetical protein n=1 Tax=Mucilaginibacter phenanthrenivorans TaxID=1234842 RepID=UPI002158440D|nr:hypothetical protein [Mucilaginibacter phenanthrenivorans]MCR8559059.1 hypothetical protein [Mucilaginibacter phenanthrenivorans]